MNPQEEKKLFELLDNIPVEISSLASETFGSRFRAYSGAHKLPDVADRVGLLSEILGKVGMWKKIALHLPHDARTDEEAATLAELLGKNGLVPGSVFVEFPQAGGSGASESDSPGSFTSPLAEVRDAAFRSLEEALERMRILGAKRMVLWLPDGWDTLAQVSFFEISLRLEEYLMRFYAKMMHDETLLLKCGAPGPPRYLSAISSAGQARDLCTKLGLNAKVLLNAPAITESCSLEQEIAFLLRSDAFGGIHFTGQAAPRQGAGSPFDPWGTFRAALILLEAQHLNYAPLESLSFVFDRYTDSASPLAEISTMTDTLTDAFLRAAQVDLFDLAQARSRPWIGDADKIVLGAFSADLGDIKDKYRQARTQDAGPGPAPPPEPSPGPQNDS
jgi:L-rhamnose isomerase